MSMVWTDCNTEIWLVKFYGCLEDNSNPHQDHLVIVAAESCEEAIAAVRELHDSAAVILFCIREWLVEKV